VRHTAERSRALAELLDSVAQVAVGMEDDAGFRD
jgi:hypothetical protein